MSGHHGGYHRDDYKNDDTLNLNSKHQPSLPGQTTDILMSWHHGDDCGDDGDDQDEYGEDDDDDGGDKDDN